MYFMHNAKTVKNILTDMINIANDLAGAGVKFQGHLTIMMDEERFKILQ